MAKRNDPFAVEILPNRLDGLLGQTLSTFALAADMPMLGFGPIHIGARGGAVPTYSLHLQCPWRLRSASGILTGHSDLYSFAGTDEPAGWTYEQGNSRLQTRLHAVIATEPRVLSVEVEPLVGDIRLGLSGDLALEVFPDGTDDEQWRFLKPHTDDDHVVFPVELD